MMVFENETKDILYDLNNANGYLDCENVIIYNLKKHVINGVPIPDIDNYLKKLLTYMQDKTVINKGNKEWINYQYAAGFLNTIVSTPNWHSWIKIAEPE